MDIKRETAEQIDSFQEIENMKKIEAALFISGRFLSIQELVMLTDINPILLRQFLEKLTEKYDENSAMEIIEKSDMWKMDVKSEHTSLINKLATGSSEFSRAEQETLAIIAYKQPIKQSIIVKIRGNKAYEHVRKFVELGLIKAKKLGRTKELTLSNDFYDYFKLEKKSELRELNK